MDVILNQDVEHVGDKNDMVTVKSGFGRNYLIPQGLAMLATPSAKKMHAENVKQKAFKEWNTLNLPVTEKIHNEVLSLPIGAHLRENEIETIINLVNKFK